MTKDFVNVGKANHESNANLISIPPHCYLMRQFRTPHSTPISPVGRKIYAQKKRKGEPQCIQISSTCLLLKSFCDRKLRWALENHWSHDLRNISRLKCINMMLGFGTTKMKFKQWAILRLTNSHATVRLLSKQRGSQKQ